MIRRMFSRSLYVGTMTSARSRAGSDDTSAVDDDTGAQREEREHDGDQRHELSLLVCGIVEVEADPLSPGRQRNTEERVIGADGRNRRPAIDARGPPGKIVLRHDERRARRRRSAQLDRDMAGIVAGDASGDRETFGEPGQLRSGDRGRGVEDGNAEGVEARVEDGTDGGFVLGLHVRGRDPRRRVLSRKLVQVYGRSSGVSNGPDELLERAVAELSVRVQIAGVGEPPEGRIQRVAVVAVLCVAGEPPIATDLVTVV